MISRRSGMRWRSHPATLAEAFISGIGYLAGALGYAAAPILLTAIVAKPSRTTIADMLWPPEPPRRLATTIFILPLLLPVLMAIAAGEKVVSLWAIGSMTLLPVMLLGSPLVAMPRIAAIRILAIAVALPVLAIVAAPVVAVVTHLNGTPNYGAHYSLVAKAAEQSLARYHRAAAAAGRQLQQSALRLAVLLSGTSVDVRDREPVLTPWTDEARIAREGILLYCPMVEKLCMDALDKRAADARRVEVEMSRSFFGIAGPSVRYVIVAIPPR